MASQESNIHLYTAQTPNGIKISITLEELGLPYKVTKLSFAKNEQKEPWFLEINPNGRIPAIADTFTDGKQIRLFESGSIQQYLADRYDKNYKISYPRGTREYMSAIALFPQRRGWVSAAFWAGVDLDEFPALKAWEKRMLDRPAVEKGRHVPEPHTIRELGKKLEEVERHAAETAAWI